MGGKMNELLTRHARIRMNSRGISKYAIDLAVSICKPIYSKGAEFYFIGKKAVKKYIDVVPDIEKYEGVVVVLNARSHGVMTVYRNKNFMNWFKRNQ
jgi:hypothetical protein